MNTVRKAYRLKLWRGGVDDPPNLADAYPRSELHYDDLDDALIEGTKQAARSVPAEELAYRISMTEIGGVVFTSYLLDVRDDQMRYVALVDRIWIRE